ncbi:hypothetical protein EB1_28180 [Empedobacter brevis NBRC 14943 = ATCC 43319]|uniref:Uncharacterized protein n=1 Tax=Empedobacter brevis NBRC 14943 = ATCC 43319 TaxID=1218108 RepID=A0A511NKS5_9FLAO|nr:hypothetical protein EB1_28180 [Empedobacter brevis NBRC 14943 = ATCC 43319]
MPTCAYVEEDKASINVKRLISLNFNKNALQKLFFVFISLIFDLGDKMVVLFSGRW